MAKIEWNEDAFNKAFDEWNKKTNGRLVFNDLDKQTALKDRNFFNATVQNKYNYLTAQDKGDTVGMQEANNAQNMTRRQYGYTLGSDGNTPTLYNDPKLDTSISTQKPADYVNKYKNKIDSLYNSIANSKFSYDVNSDPSYQAYKAAYVRDGNRAMQDTLGEALGSSGFAGSSYANTAATQANDYYMSQLNDKVPELYQQAYARYQDELANKNQNLNTLMNMENNDYSRYRDAISDYNNDRSFEWNQKQAKYSADVYRTETQKEDARYEADRLDKARQTAIANQLAQEQIDNEAKANERASLLDWFKVKGYGYDPTTGEIVQGLDYTKTMGYDQYGNPTLDYRKYKSDDENTKWGLQNDLTKINNDYNIGLMGKQNEATKIDNDFRIGSANAETNRMNAITNRTNASTNQMKATTDNRSKTVNNVINALNKVVTDNSYIGLDMNGKQKKMSKLSDAQIKKEQAKRLNDLYNTSNLTSQEVSYIISLFGLSDTDIK